MLHRVRYYYFHFRLFMAARVDRNIVRIVVYSIQVFALRAQTKKIRRYSWFVFNRFSIHTGKYLIFSKKT